RRLGIARHPQRSETRRRSIGCVTRTAAHQAKIPCDNVIYLLDNQSTTKLGSMGKDEVLSDEQLEPGPCGVPRLGGGAQSAAAMAEVDWSGSSWSSSERVMPISSARSNASSCCWSARLGQAG